MPVFCRLGLCSFLILPTWRGFCLSLTVVLVHVVFYIISRVYGMYPYCSTIMDLKYVHLGVSKSLAILSLKFAPEWLSMAHGCKLKYTSLTLCYSTTMGSLWGWYGVIQVPWCRRAVCTTDELRKIFHIAHGGNMCIVSVRRQWRSSCIPHFGKKCTTRPLIIMNMQWLEWSWWLPFEMNDRPLALTKFCNSSSRWICNNRYRIQLSGVDFVDVTSSSTLKYTEADMAMPSTHIPMRLGHISYLPVIGIPPGATPRLFFSMGSGHVC